ncbi:hypothetical protein XA68_16322 [Ophiocordyceps unilateralis]|uniref:Uncharacterized protein n=1 Tax=Ophiocordyceps unilateralis TaxID=268505 RepID=A0A2A9P5F6_OPHUN|nr:hypothetical protein XA68_16322 [Ophiocordyceps unilateralis]
MRASMYLQGPLGEDCSGFVSCRVHPWRPSLPLAARRAPSGASASGDSSKLPTSNKQPFMRIEQDQSTKCRRVAHALRKCS